MRALLVAILLAQAGAEPARDAAQRLLDEGAALYDARDYPAALAKFEEAYRVLPDSKLLFNIAETHRRLGHAGEARTGYESFLRQVGPDTPAELVALARQALEAIGDPEREAPPRAGGPLTTPPVPPAPPVLVAGPGTRAAEPAAEGSLYRRWTLWTGLGVAVVGGIVAAALLAQRGDRIPAGEHVVDDRHR